MFSQPSALDKTRSNILQPISESSTIFLNSTGCCHMMPGIYHKINLHHEIIEQVELSQVMQEGGFPGCICFRWQSLLQLKEELMYRTQSHSPMCVMSKRNSFSIKPVTQDQDHSQQDKSAIEVIELNTNEPDPIDKDILTTQSSLKQIWVWNHFKECSDSLAAVCQVMIKNCACCASLKKDWSGSTRNFHEYLLKKHNLVDHKLNQKLDKAQSDIRKFLKNNKLLPKACNV
ncbi:uncharacterized protein VP01_2286g5 [Puccinia sorghi]|uniref:Uncharacterized protein n=1 Tax=Puccinia sorghi TaxID=27349 RepID=A0A0L6V846_9BASI|nr:uncharacterized protein VP01_2286g5 [Puccinia sorghi]